MVEKDNSLTKASLLGVMYNKQNRS